jgi:group I intron endonuclease
MFESTFYSQEEISPTTVPKQPGVYGIFCIPAKKWYIGQAKNIHRRFKDHKRELGRFSHENTYLNAAAKKYGKDAFLYFVLEYCPIDSLNKIENFYIDYYNSIDRSHGYNLCKIDMEDNHIYSEETLKRREKVYEKTRIVFTDDFADKVREMFRTEFSAPQISKLLGISKKSVFKIIHNKINYNPNYTHKLGKTIKTKIVDEISKYVHSGYSREEISKITGYSDRYVLRVLQSKGFGKSTYIKHKTLLLNKETGIYYNTIREAADSLGIKRATLSWRMANSGNHPFITVGGEIKKQSNQKEIC